MGHVQLRRYVIKEGRYDEFLAFWRGLVPIRERYGYTILFAFADRANHQFVWAVEHPDPLEDADPIYNASPERTAHMASNTGAVASILVSEIEPVIEARAPGQARPGRRAVDEARLRGAVARLHPITALLSLVHMTGDPTLLDRYGPALDGSQPPVTSYKVLRDPDPRPPSVPDPAVVTELRERLVARVRDGAPPALELPDPELFARMARLCLGFEVSRKDLPMVMEQGGFVTDTRIVRPTVAPPPGFHVVVIGAGMIGVNAGVKLAASGFDYTILEARHELGGTWSVNRFPKAAVDTPSSEYSFSFEPNPSWSRYFPTGPEYLDYVKRVADRYDVTRHIHFGTRMTRCAWDDERHVWIVTATRGGRTVTYEANAVVAATGFLNRPSYPDVAGMNRFAGPVMHSAEWDDGVALDGRSVVLVGTGCTAAQVATGIAERSRRLTIVQRQPNWVIPNPLVLKEVPELERWGWEKIPFVYKWSRVESMSPGINRGPMRDEATFDPDHHARTGGISALNDQIKDLARAYAAEKLGHRPDLLAKVLPSFPPFAKRQVLDPGYYDTLLRPNVELVEGELAGLEEHAVVLADGTRLPADAVILATGFKLDFFSTLEVVGRGGRDLRAAWSPRPMAYLGLTVPGFPNFFVTCGPNSGLASDHATLGEQQVHYIIEALQLMLEEDIVALDVTREAFERYNEMIDECLRRTVFDGHKGTAHGYYRHESGRSVLAYPKANIEYWTDLRRPALADYHLTRRPARTPAAPPAPAGTPAVPAAPAP
jgi:cation diffusion facilitator CzcD-associated flavoprotein CzcO